MKSDGRSTVRYQKIFFAKLTAESGKLPTNTHSTILIMSTIISTRSLNIWYNGLQALYDVQLEIPEKRITALIGASGSGKSTFLRSLNRMLDTVPQARVEGSILVDGKEVNSAETDVIELRKNVGMVFQNPTPFPLSLYENVAYGLQIQGLRRKRRSFFRLKSARIIGEELEKSEDKIDQSVVRSLKEAALWEEVQGRLHKSAFRLSGGQQQRLCIARAIAVRPSVLLLDEPCSQLDPISTHKIEQLLLTLKDHYTIVIVTHNLQQARRISDDVGFFHLGRLIEFGETRAIFENPRETLTKEYVRGEFG